MLIAKQVGSSEWIGVRKPLAVLPWEPDEIPLTFTDDRDDLDALKIAVVEALDGWKFGFIKYANSPQRGTSVYVHADDEVMPTALDSLMRAVELTQDEFLWISPLALGR
jgi:hypothetical protein